MFSQSPENLKKSNKIGFYNFSIKWLTKNWNPVRAFLQSFPFEKFLWKTVECLRLFCGVFPLEKISTDQFCYFLIHYLSAGTPFSLQFWLFATRKVSIAGVVYRNRNHIRSLPCKRRMWMKPRWGSLFVFEVSMAAFAPFRDFFCINMYQRVIINSFFYQRVFIFCSLSVLRRSIFVDNVISLSCWFWRFCFLWRVLLVQASMTTCVV